MKLKILLITFLIALGILATAKTNLFLDPDFGWEIRTGQYIFEHGIPYSDPFSYTMQSFPFIAHSWLSDISFYALFQYIGYAGLSCLIALLVILSLVITQVPFQSQHKIFKKVWILIPLSLGFSALLPYLSVRPQVFSWFFFSIFTIILLNKKYWYTYRSFLPIIMLIWVNVHGAFAIGFALFLYIYFHRLIEGEKFEKKDKLIFVLTLLATCVNPYGLHIWREVFATFADNKLRTQVSEWNPLILRLTFFHIPILALSLVFSIRYYKKLPRQLTNIFFFMLFFGLTSSKLFPLWTIVAVHLISQSIIHLEKTFQKNQLVYERFSLFLSLVSLFSIGALIIHIPFSWNIYKNFKEETFYPKSAVNFIEERNLSNNVFTSFNWGGYMLWKMPQRKTFIDGRMTYWEQNQAPYQESTDAFSEYNDILAGITSIDEAIQKYHIRTILLPKKDPYKPLQEFRMRMSKLGFSIVYQDDIAIVYDVSKPTRLKP
jgi:hypothetical protein